MARTLLQGGHPGGGGRLPRPPRPRLPLPALLRRRLVPARGQLRERRGEAGPRPRAEPQPGRVVPEGEEPGVAEGVEELRAAGPDLLPGRRLPHLAARHPADGRGGGLRLQDYR